jgi:pimeloyl-ACP methyl ester carboxylesterase
METESQSKHFTVLPFLIGELYLYSAGMKEARVIEIQTPKKFLLNGLWFGPGKPKKVIIWIHGLASSAFSKLGIVEQLIDTDTAVMTFNNRGAASVTRVRKLNPKKKGGFEFVIAGGSHEVFTECADDIQGAVDFAQKHGAKEIYLAGHSTGAQKSVYYATRKGNDTKVKGVILLAPMSDYAGALKEFGKKALQHGIRASEKLIKAGNPHVIVPNSWVDAQRYISLFSPESTEEIFSYVDPEKKPKIYESLIVPALVVLAADDEYADRPAGQIEAWFVKHSRSKRLGVRTIPKTDHGFSGAEKAVTATIRQWMNGSTVL